MLPQLLGMLGQAALPYAANWAMNKGMDWLNGPQGMDPNVQAQQNYLQQIQQPINTGTAQRQQQMMNEFNQQILPGIQEQFAGAGGARSSAFGQQLGSAAGNLQANLGALGEQNQYQNAQLNQQRLGELGGYLGGQQRLGLEAQGLNQRGSIANMENALRSMGLMQNYDLGRQEQETKRMDVMGRLLGGYGQTGMGSRFDTKHHGPIPAGIWDLLGKGANVAGSFVGGATGMQSPFTFRK